jgi:hypothetical protein
MGEDVQSRHRNTRILGGNRGEQTSLSGRQEERARKPYHRIDASVIVRGRVRSRQARHAVHDLVAVCVADPAPGRIDAPAEERVEATGAADAGGLRLVDVEAVHQNVLGGEEHDSAAGIWTVREHLRQSIRHNGEQLRKHK